MNISVEFSTDEELDDLKAINRQAINRIYVRDGSAVTSQSEVVYLGIYNYRNALQNTTTYEVFRKFINTFKEQLMLLKADGVLGQIFFTTVNRSWITSLAT